jgi:hypothetical protein
MDKSFVLCEVKTDFIYNLDELMSRNGFLCNSNFHLLERCHISEELIAFPYIIILSFALLTTYDNYVYTVTSRDAGLAVYAMICHASQKQPLPLKTNHSDTFGTTKFLERRICRPSRDVSEHLSHQRTRFAMFQSHTQITNVLYLGLPKTAVKYA